MQHACTCGDTWRERMKRQTATQKAPAFSKLVINVITSYRESALKCVHFDVDFKQFSGVCTPRPPLGRGKRPLQTPLPQHLVPRFKAFGRSGLAPPPTRKILCAPLILCPPLFELKLRLCHQIILNPPLVVDMVQKLQKTRKVI